MPRRGGKHKKGGGGRQQKKQNQKKKSQSQSAAAHDKDKDVKPTVDDDKTNADVEAITNKVENTNLAQNANATDENESKSKDEISHKFWNTQPVPSAGAKVSPSVSQPVEVRTLVDVRKESLRLPSTFEWFNLDIADDKQLAKLYELLTHHYVADDHGSYRFDYSPDFLRWAMLVPGTRPEYMLGVRVKDTGLMVAFIGAIPCSVQIHDKSVDMVAIDFLCVHAKLRGKRLAPVLIQEITRRVNCNNRWQAIFTAAASLCKQITVNKYYHRPINLKKLIEIKFWGRNRQSLPMQIKLYRIDNKFKTNGFRPMTENDCDAAFELLTNYVKRYEIYLHFTKASFRHTFLTRKSIVYSFVVENPDTKTITDFISFYTVDSTLNTAVKLQHNGFRNAYMYYYALSGNTLSDLVNDCVIVAKRENCDVFSALDIMDNKDMFQNNKFSVGSGCLNYYLYNWECNAFQSDKVGVVLL